MSDSALLPGEFAGLTPFVSEWSLPTEFARNRKRLSSRMEEIQAFYDAILPQMEKIIEHLNQFPLDKMPEAEQRLLNLALSFMEAATAIEMFRAPDEPGIFDPERFELHEAESF